MTIGGDYESLEKASIREQLWIPAFKTLINEGTNAGDIRYLCFPGAHCVFLKQLEQEIGFDRGNVVAVEKEDAPHTAIHQFLGGRGVALLGTFEELMARDSLRKQFPFDVLNLDFCGQGFVFRDNDSTSESSDPTNTDRWKAIRKTFELQADAKISDYYMLLTFASNRNSTVGTMYLRGEARRLVGQTKTSKKVADWNAAQLVQEVVPSLIAAVALDYDYKTIDMESFRYRQSGKSYSMVAFRFRFRSLSAPQLGALTHKQNLLEEFQMEYFSKESREL